MELNEMMDKELKRRFEDLESMTTGSDEQGKATDNIVKLYKLRMDEKEANVSKEADEDKLELEKHKLELESNRHWHHGAGLCRGRPLLQQWIQV